MGPRRSAQPLSDRYRLEDFIVGDSNRLAYDVAVRVAESEPIEGVEAERDHGRGNGQTPRPCGPLFIHGLCGLGKTHLLQGIALRFKQRRPGAMVRFTTGESFTNEFITALHGEGSRAPGAGKNAMERFRRSYRRVDLLCIDDVHFLASKSATQTELLHTFNELELSGAQIVMACDEHPKHVKKFSEALTSRFMSGMVVRVQPPDRELCEKIARQFGERRGLIFDDAALKGLSARVAALPGRGGAAAAGEHASARGLSIREIEGLVTRIEACVRLGARAGAGEAVCRVTVAVVQHVLGGMFGSQDLAPAIDAAEAVDRRHAGEALRSLDSSSRGIGASSVSAAASGRPIKLQSIVMETCRMLGVDSSDFTGTGRQPRVVLARSVVAHLARRMTGLSFPEIARGMGRPSHSTVIAACQRLERQLAAGDGLGASVSGLDLTISELCDRLAATISGKRA